MLLISVSTGPKEGLKIWRTSSNLAFDGEGFASIPAPLHPNPVPTALLYCMHCQIGSTTAALAVEFNLHDKCARSAEWISMLSTQCGNRHIDLLSPISVGKYLISSVVSR